MRIRLINFALAYFAAVACKAPGGGSGAVKDLDTTEYEAANHGSSDDGAAVRTLDSTMGFGENVLEVNGIKGRVCAQKVNIADRTNLKKIKVELSVGSCPTTLFIYDALQDQSRVLESLDFIRQDIVDDPGYFRTWVEKKGVKIADVIFQRTGITEIMKNLCTGDFKDVCKIKSDRDGNFAAIELIRPKK